MGISHALELARSKHGMLDVRWGDLVEILEALAREDQKCIVSLATGERHYTESEVQQRVREALQEVENKTNPFHGVFTEAEVQARIRAEVDRVVEPLEMYKDMTPGWSKMGEKIQEVLKRAGKA